MFTTKNFVCFIVAAALATIYSLYPAVAVLLQWTPTTMELNKLIPVSSEPGSEHIGWARTKFYTNKAWTAPCSVLDLFLESFRVGDKTEPLLKHLIIVAVDAKAFEGCKLVHLLCYSLDVGGGMDLTREQAFMSKDYLEMMWARNKFQTRVLELGYSFIFTDVDIVWFRNALLHIPVGADIAISCDRYNGEDVQKFANGGFLYARQNARTVGFFKGWYEARTGRLNEQDVFNNRNRELSRRHNVTVNFIDTAYWGGFCQPKKDFRRLCTFHGNCLKGMRSKLLRLRGILDEWKHFKIARQLQANKSTLSH